MPNHYVEKNYTYINDINLVWREGGQLNNLQLIEKKTHIDRKKVHVYKQAGKIGVEVCNAYSIVLLKKQQQTDMAFFLKVLGIITFILFCLKKRQ